MKLFGKELKFLSSDKEEQEVKAHYPISFGETKKKKLTASSKEIGGTGTPIFSGIISGEEYLPELQYRQALMVYDRMRKSDATVGAALLACKLPLLGAKWFIEAADTDDPQSQMIADFVEQCLMDKSETDWQDFLRQSLLMLDFGYMVFEKVFQVVEYEYDSDDLKVPKKDYIGWKKFASRLPKSIYRWEMSPEPGGNKPRAGVTQILPQGGTPEIPMEKLLLFINNKEGDNYNGVSILRNAYKHWYFKDTFYKLDAIGYERHAVGIPMMKLPPGFDESDKAIAEELLANIRGNERQYMVIPNTWEVDFMDMHSTTLKNPEKAILHHDQEILKSVLAQFLNLGTGNTSGGGSRALSSDHSDMFFESLKSVARHICDVINKHAIPQLVDMNFDVDKYPKLSFAKIGKIDFQAYATALQNLATAQLIIPDNSLEEYLREQFELPDKDDTEPVDYESEGGDAQDNSGDQRAEAGNRGKVKTDPKGLEKDNPAEDKNEAPQKQPDSENNSQFRNRASEVKKKSRVRLSEMQGEEVFQSWRPLTFAEKKVNFKLIQDRITEYENRFKGDARDHLMQSIEPLLKEFKQHLHDKNMDGVKNLVLPYKNNYALTVLKYLKLPYEFGKKTASSEMKMQAPQTPQTEADRIRMQADMVADLHENDIIKAMKLKAIDVLKRIKASEPAEFATKRKKPLHVAPKGRPSGITPTEEEMAAGVSILPKTDQFEIAMEEMAGDMADVIDTITENTANLTIGMLYNQGRSLAQDVNGDNIYALQRSEVLDADVCDFCLSMDGLILDKDDPDAQEDEYHSNCRGMWVEIMNDEAELPEITGVPEDLSNLYGGVNDIGKMKGPILRENTPAYDYYHHGK
jgi:hypothetical protein